MVFVQSSNKANLIYAFCHVFFSLQQGRQTKRQVFILPGCTRMLKVQTSSVRTKEISHFVLTPV